MGDSQFKFNKKRMITFIFALATLFFLLLSAALFSIYVKYFNENDVLNKKLAEISKMVKEYEDAKIQSNNINVDSTGYFKHSYYDDGLKIPSTIFIPMRVVQKDISGNTFKFDFDFKKFKKDNKRKHTQIEFDSNTISYLKLIEHQWHSTSADYFVWAEFEKEYYEDDINIDDFKFKEDIQKEVAVKEQNLINLNDFEKNDINSFLKFSNISEETKDSIRKLLKI